MWYKKVLAAYMSSKTCREAAAKLCMTPAKLRYVIANIKSQLSVEYAERIPYLPL